MSYKFIDLFAGIGGFHLALSRAKMKCVFASEIDRKARETYLINHKLNVDTFNDDIRKISPADIPDHDILCAGFPCQPFSQAGHKRGFEDGSDSERGNLFFCIADILSAKRPKSFILENVRHLLKHDEGKTFEIIKKTLEELDYSVYFKVIRASDFGRPQHRPRIYIVGFDNKQVNTSEKFEFPEPIPLKLTMSDIWNGKCERKVGFTLRVGGRGSSIDDRRNWDSYRVNGKVKQLTPLEGKRMMGFPDEFILPKEITHAMKQLGNSVCVDVIEHIANSVKKYLIQNTNKKLSKPKNYKMNKGEWSEIYAFFKLLIDNKLFFADANFEKINDYVTVIAISHNHSDLIYNIFESSIIFKNHVGEELSRKKVSDLFSRNDIEILLDKIKSGKGRTFSIPSLNSLVDSLSIRKTVKGRSFDKGDLNISFIYENLKSELAPIGIKSYLGAKPTILNASSATNFVFEVENLKTSIDEINSINTKSKIRDRICAIKKFKGSFKFVGCELDIHTRNLKMIDSLMPEIIAKMLLCYYSGKGRKISELIDNEQEQCRFKDYLKAILLGMFYTKKWDGTHVSKGTILISDEGELKLYHVLKEELLKDFFFYHAKLDTPSSTRHRFGSLYRENGKVYIKLNLQIRLM